MLDLEISLRYHLSKYKKERVKISSGAEGEFSGTIWKTYFIRKIGTD